MAHVQKSAAVQPIAGIARMATLLPCTSARVVVGKPFAVIVLHRAGKG
jgi:hypothetical protein